MELTRRAFVTSSAAAAAAAGVGVSFPTEALAAGPFRILQEWALPHGRNSEEEHNRNHNLALRARLWRAPIAVTEDGHFRPAGTNVVLQGRSYEDAFALAEEHGLEVLPCLFLHTNGDTHGTGYHGYAGIGRGPILDPSTVRRFTEEFVSWLRDTGVPVWAWTLGNEMDDVPTVQGDPRPTYEQWEHCFIELVGAVGGGPRFVSPGTHGTQQRLFFEGPTINWWLASSGRWPAMIYDVHGNGLSDGELDAQIRNMRSLGVTVGVFEDSPPGGTSSRARDRARVARNAGAVAYAVFGSRVVNYAGGDDCRWGVFPSGKHDTSHIGVESCDFSWHRENFAELTAASTEAGELLPGKDLPVETMEHHPSKVLAGSAAALLAKSCKGSPAAARSAVLDGRRAKARRNLLLKARLTIDEALEEL